MLEISDITRRSRFSAATVSRVALHMIPKGGILWWQTERPAPVIGGADVVTSTIEVKGMSCGHCVQAVTSELGRINGVTDVSVDLVTGQVTFSSPEPINPTSVANAIEEAGFELVP